MSWSGLRQIGRREIHDRLNGELPPLPEDKPKHLWFWIVLSFLQALRVTETPLLKHVRFLFRHVSVIEVFLISPGSIFDLNQQLYQLLCNLDRGSSHKWETSDL